jgi:hypothetical protein
MVKRRTLSLLLVTMLVTRILENPRAKCDKVPSHSHRFTTRTGAAIPLEPA